MAERLDAALVARGLARSRTHAAKLIADGLVSVNSKSVIKAATKVSETDDVRVDGGDHYVSRAAHKLLLALDSFGVDPAGKTVLDVGASTGGFTQVLLERGAQHVIALDVGHDQLANELRADERVTVVEGFNARDLTRETLAGASGYPNPVPLAVTDVSFISLGYVFGPIASVLTETGELIALIKPQFEVGKTAVKGGLVTEKATRADAAARVLWEAWDTGFGVAGFIASPILGTHGNAEYLVHLKKGAGDNPSAWLETVNRIAGE